MSLALHSVNLASEPPEMGGSVLRVLPMAQLGTP
jgi:hypothetical protein